MKIRVTARKGIGVVLSFAMVAGLIPTYMKPIEVKADGTGGALTVTSFATAQQLQTVFDLDGEGDITAKIKFGMNNESEQEWYVAGKDSEGGDNIVLFAAEPVLTEQAFETSWTSNKEYTDSWGCSYSSVPDEVYPNHYGASILRKELKTLETGRFSAAEQALMQATTLATKDSMNDSVYTTEDKLYAAYGDYKNGSYITVGTNTVKKLNEGLKIDKSYWKDSKFWLRSPSDFYEDEAMTAYPGHRVHSDMVDSYYAVWPAFRLDLQSVLFASAVPASKPAASSIGNDSPLTLRLDGSGKLSGSSAAYTRDWIRVNAAEEQQVTLVVQGNNGTKDWYYAANINGKMTITAESIALSLNGTLNSAPDLTDCKVWIETTDASERLTYAMMASVLTEISEVSVTGIDTPMAAKPLDMTAVSITNGIAKKTLTVRYEAVENDSGDDDDNNGDDDNNDGDGDDENNGDDGDDENNGDDDSGDEDFNLEEEYLLDGDEIAKPNTIYTAYVTLEPASGYTFTSDTIVTINGNPAEVDYREDDETIEASYEFPATSINRLVLKRIDGSMEPLEEGYTSEQADENTVTYQITNGTDYSVSNVRVELGDGALSAFGIVQNGGGYEAVAAQSLGSGESVEIAVRTKTGLKCIKDEDDEVYPYTDTLSVSCSNVDAGTSVNLEQMITEKELEPVDEIEASLEEGTYQSNQTVSLSCGTPGAIIYYTLDESEPDDEENPKRYRFTTPISLTGKAGEPEDYIITAVAVKEGMEPSNASFEYTIAIPGTKYAVTVNHGSGSGTYEKGSIVAISADAPPAGKQFKRWRAVTGDIDFGDIKSAETTFEMPEEDVEVTAVYEDKKPVIITQPVNQTVEEGERAVFTIVAEGNGISYQWLVNRNDGKGFVEVKNNGTSADYTTSVTNLDYSGYRYKCIVSNSAGDAESNVVSLTVSQKQISVFRITVTSSGNGSASASQPLAKDGDAVTLKAVPEKGYIFKEWQVVSGAVTISDRTSATASFIMPTESVEVKAVFEKEPVPPASEIPPASEMPPATEVTPASEMQPEKGTDQYIRDISMEWVEDSIVIAWDEVDGAKGYDVYAGVCGKSLKKVATVKDQDTFKVELTEIEKEPISEKKAYKAIVRAYKKTGGKKVYFASSPGMHLVSKNNPIYTNIKKIRVSKSSYVLKKGKTAQIKATYVKENKSKSLLATGHGPILKYTTTNTKVASVTQKGKIKAKKRGVCYIYITALNGVKKSVKVTVK